MKRAVITRIGVISPNAVDYTGFVSAIFEGRSGLKTIDYFDASTFLCRIVGQVPEVDRNSLMQKYPELESVQDIKVFLAAFAFEDALGKEEGILEGNCAINLGTSLESFNIAKLLDLSPNSFCLEKYTDAVRDPALRKPFLQLPLDYFSNMVRRHFRLNGPAFLNCSACTASTQSIGHSFHMIRDGRYSQVIAGGFDSMLNPLGLGGFSVLGALCTDNSLGTRAIKPFDLRRQGTILGEGAAVLLLEELDFALSRGRKPIAEVIGYASTFDAFKISKPDPDGNGIGTCMEKALADAGISPDMVDYINAHGTGTPLNDSSETAAIRRVFRKHADGIPVSSIKSMIGHTIGASGAIETAGVVGMIQKGFVSPTINLEVRDPECDLDYVPGRSRKLEIRTAVKNSSGFGGQNAVLVLRRYPD